MVKEAAGRARRAFRQHGQHVSMGGEKNERPIAMASWSVCGPSIQAAARSRRYDTCHDEFSSSREAEATTTEIENSDTTQRLNGADLLYMFCISTHISVQ